MVGASTRPGTRDLVRWNEELDKGLLLTIQYACGESGIKLPWQRIAEIMGPKFSEGSITQHLAKIRKKMGEQGIPVPPALKRGYVAKTPSKIYGGGSNPPNLKFEPVTPLYADTPKDAPKAASFYDTPMTPAGVEASDHEEGTPSKAASGTAAAKGRARTRVAAKTGKGKGKGKGSAGRVAMSDEDEDDVPMPELYDSEDEFKVPRKKLMSGIKKTQVKKQNKTLARVKVEENGSPGQAFSTKPGNSGQALNQNEGGEIALPEPVTPSGPARHTRGVKRDYSMMGDSEDSNEDVSDAGETAGDGDEENGGGGDQGGAAIPNALGTTTQANAVIPLNGMFPDPTVLPEQDFELPLLDYKDPMMNNMGNNTSLTFGDNSLLTTGNAFSGNIGNTGYMANSGYMNNPGYLANTGFMSNSTGYMSNTGLGFSPLQQNMSTGVMGAMTPSMYPLQNFQPSYGNLYPSTGYQNYIPQQATYSGTIDAGTMAPPPVPYPITGSAATETSGMTTGTVTRDTSMSAPPGTVAPGDMATSSADEYLQFEQLQGQEQEMERAWAHHQAGGDYNTYGLQGGNSDSLPEPER